MPLAVGNDGGPWYHGTVIRVVGGPILYNASTGVMVCGAKPGGGGENPCPGSETAAAARSISCTVCCAAAKAAAFPEIVTIRVPTGAGLSGAANGDVSGQFRVCPMHSIM